VVERDDKTLEALRRAHENLSRRIVAERLIFADRVQEAVDEARRIVVERDRQIEQLTRDLESVRGRVESLHDELRQAHAELEAIKGTRLFRLNARLRGL
jgi:phage shock protein A